jgi:hypothetical protein
MLMKKKFGWQDLEELGVQDLYENVQGISGEKHVEMLLRESPEAYSVLSKCLEWDTTLYRVGQALFYEQLDDEGIQYVR